MNLDEVDHGPEAGSQQRQAGRGAVPRELAAVFDPDESEGPARVVHQAPAVHLGAADRLLLRADDDSAGPADVVVDQCQAVEHDTTPAPRRRDRGGARHDDRLEEGPRRFDPAAAQHHQGTPTGGVSLEAGAGRDRQDGTAGDLDDALEFVDRIAAQSPAGRQAAGQDGATGGRLPTRDGLSHDRLIVANPVVGDGDGVEDGDDPAAIDFDARRRRIARFAEAREVEGEDVGGDDLVLRGIGDQRQVADAQVGRGVGIHDVDETVEGDVPEQGRRPRHPGWPGGWGGHAGHRGPVGNGQASGRGRCVDPGGRLAPANRAGLHPDRPVRRGRLVDLVPEARVILGAGDLEEKSPRFGSQGRDGQAGDPESPGCLLHVIHDRERPNWSRLPEVPKPGGIEPEGTSNPGEFHVRPDREPDRHDAARAGGRIGDDQLERAGEGARLRWRDGGAVAAGERRRE